jgi:hypothetical protein
MIIRVHERQKYEETVILSIQNICSGVKQKRVCGISARTEFVHCMHGVSSLGRNVAPEEMPGNLDE